MWGIIPAAGAGSRIQPLAFSKELLPVGSRLEANVERPRAVSEYLLERMMRGGASNICFVIGPGKSDILEYYGGRIGSTHICYTVQPRPGGLCDAIFSALPLIPETEHVLIGLPDTIWFPEDGLARLPDGMLSFLLFPVQHPEYFDAVITNDEGMVKEIQVKRTGAASEWVWGAFKMPGSTLKELHHLWCEREQRDEYMGTLVNEYLARGGQALGLRAGEGYVDVGTINGYREAIQLLSRQPKSHEEVFSIRKGGRRRTDIEDPSPAVPFHRMDTQLRNTAAHSIGASLSTMEAITQATMQEKQIYQRIQELGPWFHNMNLGGVMTAPNHFLGDYPAIKWERFKSAIPADLSGKTVLDIGCNAGFYSIEMKKRGAERVVGIDSDKDYLAQARFAAEITGSDVEFKQLDVYDVGKLGEKFDLVLFLGVFYHLRHPLLSLDLLHEHVVKDMLVFQSLMRGSPKIEQVQENYQFWQTEMFDSPSFPRMYFIENSYANDPTNWWFPNRAAAEAMLRSAGFKIMSNPEEEVFVCRRMELKGELRSVYPAR